jgi:hypothetical protein
MTEENNVFRKGNCVMPYCLWQIICKIESSFKFNNFIYQCVSKKIQQILEGKKTSKFIVIK